MTLDVYRKAILDEVSKLMMEPSTATNRRAFFDLLPIVMVPSPPLRPIQSTTRQSHCRASASRTRVTGSNAQKATSGSGGSDPDPERRHTFLVVFIGSDAPSLGGAAL